MAEFLSSKTRVKIESSENGVVLVYNTPWHDSEFRKRHKQFLSERFKTDRKMKFQNRRIEALDAFGREQLDSVEECYYDGKPITEHANWKELVPANWILSTASVVFEEGSSEEDAETLKKSVVSSKSTDLN